MLLGFAQLVSCDETAFVLLEDRAEERCSRGEELRVLGAHELSEIAEVHVEHPERDIAAGRRPERGRERHLDAQQGGARRARSSGESGPRRRIARSRGPREPPFDWPLPTPRATGSRRAPARESPASSRPKRCAK